MFLLQGFGSGWFCGHEPGGGGLSDTGIGEPLDSTIYCNVPWALYIVHHTIYIFFLLFCTLYTVPFTLNFVECTLHYNALYKATYLFTRLDSLASSL